MARLDTFLQLVVEQRASDLHFHAGKKPYVRMDGELIPIPFRTLSAAETRRFLEEILTDRQRQKLHQDQQVDFVYALDGIGRFRVNVAQQHFGLGAVFRVITTGVPTLGELNLPPKLEQLCELTSGLVLVTGPTGSGKSTTLAAMVRSMNERYPRHILTIEEPIEYIHEGKLSLITQREVGKHVSSFAQALRSALREAPDVIVVGELRDEETIHLALTAAETGILVLGTLHTNSAAKTITRILEVFPSSSRDEMRQALAMVLKAVVAQTLVRRRRGSGRVAALELMLWNEAVAHYIRDGKIYQLEAYLQSTGRAVGMYSLEESLAQLVAKRIIAPEDALAAASDPIRMSERLGMGG